MAASSNPIIEDDLASRLSPQAHRQQAKVAKVLAVFFILAAIGFGIRDLTYIRRAIRTKATIVAFVKSSTEGFTDYPVYTFTDKQGRSSTVKSSLEWYADESGVGRIIDVLYDPQNPGDSIQDEFFARWGMPLILGGLAAICLILTAISEVIANLDFD